MKSMVRESGRGRRGGRSLATAGVLALALGMVACGEADSREDLDSEAVGADVGGPSGGTASGGTASGGAPSARPATGGGSASGGSSAGSSGGATGGAAARPTTPPPVVRAIPAGTELVFEVTEAVSTSSHAAGQGFALRLVESVNGSGGAMIPAGATARGVVTQSHESTGPNEDAVLVVDIRSVDVGGMQRNVNGTVVSATVETSRQSSNQRTAATVATGAAAGAIVGQILGRDTRSTVAGAAVGAVAGTAVALSTRDGHANLTEGSRVTVRLSEAMTLP